jgi:sulfate permease, SulP family
MPSPGAHARRAAGARKPDRAAVRKDLVAGVSGAISSVPDGMAAGILAGVTGAPGLLVVLGRPPMGPYASLASRAVGLGDGGTP